ncbi:hypothetical protein Trydic_g21871 [Trypoxylus dichotomus]
MHCVKEVAVDVVGTSRPTDPVARIPQKTFLRNAENRLLKIRIRTKDTRSEAVASVWVAGAIAVVGGGIFRRSAGFEDDSAELRLSGHSAEGNQGYKTREERVERVVVAEREREREWAVGRSRWCNESWGSDSTFPENSNGEAVYRKVAVVENFFDIIYNVHVELEGRPGKHAGQKRTYRTITETYAFLPREAVTRFLLGCTECQKHPRSPSPVSVLPTPSPSPTLPLVPTTAPALPLATLPTPQTLNSSTAVSQAAPQISQAEITYLDLSKTLKQHEDLKTSAAPPTATSNSTTVTANCVALPLSQQQPLHQRGSVQQCQTLDLSQRNGDISQSHGKIEDSLRANSPPEPKRSSNPLDVCNLTSRDPPKTPPKKRHLNHLSDNPSPQNPPTSAPPKLWSPVEVLEREEVEKRKYFMPKEIDYSLPITTTYLKYMRSLGCAEEDALKFENKTVSRLIECFLHDLISHYFY